MDKMLFIVADDLTGAADCAARCFSSGYSADVFITPQLETWNSDACSFTTDSRFLSAFEAGQRTREVIRTIRTSNVTWYKKIDSTLRGNIGSEIDAFIEELDFDAVFMCSAFPLQKRGLSGGWLVLNDQQQKDFHLPTILASQSKYASQHIPLHILTEDITVLMRHVMDACSKGTKIFSFDAITENHLAKIIDVYQNFPYHTLLSGSAGLIGALVSEQRKEMSVPDPKGRSSAAVRRVLIVVGSGSDTACQQVSDLKDQPDVKVICADDPLDHLDFPTIVTHLPVPPKAISLDSAEGRKSLERLIRISVEVIRVQQPDLLIVAGGDTSTELLTGLGVNRLVIKEELFPGIPLTTGKGTDGKVYQVVLKPGSFGSRDIFTRLLKSLRQANEPDLL